MARLEGRPGFKQGALPAAACWRTPGERPKSTLLPSRQHSPHLMAVQTLAATASAAPMPADILVIGPALHPCGY